MKIKTPVMNLNYDQENLLFLKEKITAIQFAIFKAEINSALQLPNNIIQALKVEEDGTIWFLTSCSGAHAATIDRSFYAHLDFHKKGGDCRLQLSGNATIVENDSDTFFAMSNYSTGLKNSIVLVKMKIQQAEYFENKMEPAGSLKDRFKIVFNQLFLSNPHRTYHFS